MMLNMLSVSADLNRCKDLACAFFFQSSNPSAGPQHLITAALSYQIWKDTNERWLVLLCQS